MEEESETFEMTFELEERGDGPPRTIRSIETHPDGTRIVTEYEEVPTDDPYVRWRQRTVGGGPPREILTEFLPSPVRPPSYPADFPFLARRRSHTTESPARAVSPGARWPCDDPEVILAALVETCLAEGWARMPSSRVHPAMQENLGVTFVRENVVRLFHRTDHEQGSVIQMNDLNGAWLDVDSRDELP